jgi:hypothetical protein
VAVDTLQIIAVVQWFVQQPRMHKDVRNPACRIVANIAFSARHEVPVVLSGCRGSIVTGRARSQYLRVIHASHRHPGCWRMAILADLCCQNMAGVFASSISAIVTTEAVVRYVCMIEIRWPPCHGRMTVIAIISTSNVCWMFANCDISVVT